MNSIVAYVLWVALGLYAWFAHRRIKSLAKRVDQLNDRLYNWGAESRTSFERLQNSVRGLDLDLKRRAGELCVTPDMLIADVLAIHPRMKEVLGSVHLGGCSSCSTSAAETIGQGATSYGLDIDQILTEIHRFLEDPDEYHAEPQPHGVPIPTIQIQIPKSAENR